METHVCTPETQRMQHGAGDLPLCAHGYIIGEANGKRFVCNREHEPGSVGSETALHDSSSDRESMK